MIKPKRTKEISLTFRGFGVSPEDIESIIGRKCARAGVKGLPVKPGVRTVLKKSFVKFSTGMTDADGINGAIVRLFDYVGGFSNVAKVCDVIKPEHVELNLYLPVRDSVEQEGGVITAQVLKSLADLACDITIEL